MIGKPLPERPELARLLRESAERVALMTPLDQAKMRRDQAISFVYGNLVIANPNVTREMVEQAYDER